MRDDIDKNTLDLKKNSRDVKISNQRMAELEDGMTLDLSQIEGKDTI